MGKRYVTIFENPAFKSALLMWFRDEIECWRISLDPLLYAVLPSTLQKMQIYFLEGMTQGCRGQCQLTQVDLLGHEVL